MKFFALRFVALSVLFAQPMIASAENRPLIDFGQDLDHITPILRLPAQARAEASRRILILSGVLTVGLGASGGFLIYRTTGIARTIAIGMTAAGLFLGGLIAVEGAVGYFSNGRFLPISQTLDAIFGIHGARAATLGDYYLSSPENFGAFLNLDRDYAIQIMAMNPDLAQVMHLHAVGFVGLETVDEK